jgi:hypothetical protein
MIVPDVFSVEECKHFIEATEATRWYPAGYSHPSDFAMNDKGIADELFSRLQHVLPREFEGRPLSRINDYLHFYRYAPRWVNQITTFGGFVTSSGNEVGRIYVTLFLNDDYKCGEETLDLVEGGHVKFKAQTGSVLLSYCCITHKEEAVWSGTKYTMRTNVMFTTEWGMKKGWW